jgi:hypothetical protein
MPPAENARPRSPKPHQAKPPGHMPKIWPEGNFNLQALSTTDIEASLTNQAAGNLLGDNRLFHIRERVGVAK